MLSEIDDPEEKAQAQLTVAQLAEKPTAKTLRETLKKYIDKGLDQYIYETHLEGNLPKFLYFDEFYQMEGQVNFETLKKRLSDKQLLDSDRPMLGLIELARINLDQLVVAQNTLELVSRIEGAGNYLSRRILDYWSQNRHIRSAGISKRDQFVGECL